MQSDGGRQLITRTMSVRCVTLIGIATVVVWLSGCQRGDLTTVTVVTPQTGATPNVMPSAPSTEAVAAVPPTAPTASVARPETVADQATPGAPPPTATPVPMSLAGRLPTPTSTQTPTQAPTFAPTPDGIARRLRVPILMYHYVSTPPAGADIYRRDLSVSTDLFAAQLDRLLAEGYAVISLYDVLDAIQRGAPLPAKPVVITFDDGYRDNYENAFPQLRERQLPATIFVVTDFMDEERTAYLTWEMAREMLQAGIDIESHGRNHVSLAGKDDDYLVWQALGSLETIEYELGVRPRFVSYPAGEYDQRTIDIFTSAQYWAGVTTRQGAVLTNERLFEWPRIRVRNTTTPDELIRLLSLDW